MQITASQLVVGVACLFTCSIVLALGMVDCDGLWLLQADKGVNVSMARRLKSEAGPITAAGPYVAPLDDEAFAKAIYPAAVGGFQPSQRIDPDFLPSHNPPLGIHVAVSNMASVHLLENLICSKRRVGLSGLLVMALDNSTCPHLNRTGLLDDPKVVCLFFFHRMVQQIRLMKPEMIEHKDAPLRDLLDGIPTGAKFNSPNHALMINTKLFAMRDVVNAGFGIFLTDVDVVLLADPRLTFRKVFNKHKQVTMIFQDDTTHWVPQSLNTGFYYWMPGPQSRRVAHASITVPEWWHLDQTKVNIVLNGTLRAELCKNTRCFVKLPEWECPNGRWLNSMAQRGEKISSDPQAIRGKKFHPIAAHANYNDNIQQKLQTMRKLGIWLVESHGAPGHPLKCYRGKLPSRLTPAQLLSKPPNKKT